MKFCILASGSRGNSIYIESDFGRLLVDVGLSARQIEQRLLSREIEPQSIEGVVLTHAHGDHVRGVGVFANRYKIPVWGHPDTLAQVKRRLKPQQETKPWHGPFTVSGFNFTPFRLSHDCDPTVGYLIEWNGRKLAICTDLGVVTDEVRDHVNQAQAIVLESNHDPDMLMRGPYPWDLKERISSRKGHISNYEAGELLGEILNGSLQKVVLGHLSLENNRPQLALDTVTSESGTASSDLVEVIEQKTVSKVYQIY